MYRMKRYAIVAMIIAILILVSFLVVETLGITLLTDPSAEIRAGGWVAAAIGGGLLLADIFIPIPSSVIMIAHGAAFGVAAGFLLSFVASVGGAMIGWWIGQRGSPLIRRIVTPREQHRANAFILRYGLLAIILSRLLPIVAETVAIMAGTTAIGWKRMLVATSIGSVPPALVYAVAGSAAVDVASGALVTVGVVAVAVIAWVAGRRLVPEDAAPNDTATVTIE